MTHYDEARLRAQIEANRAAYQRQVTRDSRAMVGVATLVATLALIAMVAMIGAAR